MKKIFILLFFVSTTILSFGGNAALFSYDADELQSEFTDLQSLETMVIANQNLTIADFEQMDVDWLNRIDLEKMKTTSPVQAMFGIEDMDWTAFAWGFCCCPVGFFTIAIKDDKSSDEKLSFWVGVGVSVVIYFVGGIAGGI